MHNYSYVRSMTWPFVFIMMFALLVSEVTPLRSEPFSSEVLAKKLVSPIGADRVKARKHLKDLSELEKRELVAPLMAIVDGGNTSDEKSDAVIALGRLGPTAGGSALSIAKCLREQGVN